MKKSLLFILFFFTFVLGFTQTKLIELTFENPGRYSTSITEFTDYNFQPTGTDGRDYFIRTDGSNIRAERFDNKQGSYYFTAQDIDGEGAVLPSHLFINNINISGYSNIEFRVHLAEDDTTGEHWDRNDYVHFIYDIDNSGTFSNLIWIASNANGPNQSNRVPQIDTDFDNIGDGPDITDTFTQYTRNIMDTGKLLNIEIVFQLNSEQEDIAIDNIEIWGTLDACGAVVSWNGTSWSNGTGPDITKEAELNADYSTSSSIGSFSACSLTLNNADLLIADHSFIEIQNDIIIDAGSSISIEPYGSILQNNDLGNLINNGTISIEKETALIDSSDEYTYWSSPVSGETIEGAITDSQPSKRYAFNARNFLDHCAETDNNNILICDDGFGNGVQDDVDDNGDDWQRLGGNTVMQPGIGYATTIDDLAYANAPGLSNKQFKFTFNGDFNNGTYTIPIYRNDFEMNDSNWNFIGNPYPSAIDADLFLETNGYISTDISGSGYIDGAIFLWSQNTIASSTANGNQTLNFSNDDYAVINLAGEIAGGDGTTPIIILPSGHRSIPSGQGFFVSMSNSASADFVSEDLYTTNISFSNAMRVADASANSQFFKTTTTEKHTNSQANKLWLNLTSNNGVFSQILISYLNEATNKDDGASYDVTKFPTKGCSLYSTQLGSNKKYAIQAKSTNSIDINESINLGFKTTIPTATIFKLSIDHLQGNFLSSHAIYLKDNRLNSTHNLTNSDYNYTSEVGEFNERFEIVFKDEALFIGESNLKNSTLRIEELNNHEVLFKTSENLTIKTLSIFDLLGRQLYDLKGHKSSETYSLSNLSNAPYIAKVKLSNGVIITKKMIKK